DNGISIDGSTDLAVSDDQIMRFEASGWATDQVDGHDPAAIADAIAKARMSDRPTLIACKTVIGYGAPNKAGTHSAHGEALGAAEIAPTRGPLGRRQAPFVNPGKVLAAWRAAGARGGAWRQAWEEASVRLDPDVKASLSEPLTDAGRTGVSRAIAAAK